MVTQPTHSTHKCAADWKGHSLRKRGSVPEKVPRDPVHLAPKVASKQPHFAQTQGMFSGVDPQITTVTRCKPPASQLVGAPMTAATRLAVAAAAAPAPGPGPPGSSEASAGWRLTSYDIHDLGAVEAVTTASAIDQVQARRSPVTCLAHAFPSPAAALRWASSHLSDAPEVVPLTRLGDFIQQPGKLPSEEVRCPPLLYWCTGNLSVCCDTGQLDCK